MRIKFEDKVLISRNKKSASVGRCERGIFAEIDPESKFKLSANRERTDGAGGVVACRDDRICGGTSFGTFCCRGRTATCSNKGGENGDRGAQSRIVVARDPLRVQPRYSRCFGSSNFPSLVSPPARIRSSSVGKFGTGGAVESNISMRVSKPTISLSLILISRPGLAGT